MKRFCIRFICLLAVAGSISLLQAQALHKGNVAFDTYVGGPNLSTGILRIIVDEIVDSPDLTAKGLGPFGARGQFMATDRLGVGLDFWYARSTISYTTTELDSALGIPVDTFSVRMDNVRPRIIVRVDYHFGDNDKFDPYVAVGLGANLARFKFTTEDPYFDKNSFSLPGIIPVAYRVAFGTKFYFIPNLGTVGLTGKF
jgi:opacity protein-like surface antigen